MMATYRLLEWMALCGGFVPCALLKGVEQPEAMDGWHPVHRGHLAERMVDDPYFHSQRLGVASHTADVHGDVVPAQRLAKYHGNSTPVSGLQPRRRLSRAARAD